MNPDQGLDLLREGNRAFLEDRLPRPATSRAARLRLAAGRNPWPSI